MLGRGAEPYEILFVNDGTYHGQCDIKSDGGALSINGKRFHSTGGSAKLIEKP